MITLRFVAHTGLFNWACTIAQYGFWSTHAEAVMPDGRYLGAISDGVKARAPDYDRGTIKQEIFLEVSATADQEEIFYAFIESQIGKPYDLWAILAYFWPSRNWQSFDAWYCSELLGTGLAECGILPKEMAVKFSRVTVRDLLLLVSTRARQ
jgi:uncharacterized protein YycO